MKHPVTVATVIILVMALAHLGAVRKKEDPIVNTQTNPIALKQKVEETKGGEKGAPLPSFKLYPKEEFLADPPIESKSIPGKEAPVPSEEALLAPQAESAPRMDSESLPENTQEEWVFDDEWEEVGAEEPFQDENGIDEESSDYFDQPIESDTERALAPGG